MGGWATNCGIASTITWPICSATIFPTVDATSKIGFPPAAKISG